MEKKQLTVVVPVYNTEKYVGQCLDSILAQKYQMLEIIAVDDGSTDHSGKICDEYAAKDKRVRVIHKQNGGLISARYEGIKAASSDYITFVDSDDWIHEDMYESLMRQLLEKKADMITSGFILYWEEEDRREETDKIPAGEYDREAIRKTIIPYMLWDTRIQRLGLSASVSNKIIKKEIMMEEYTYLKNESFFYAEDAAVAYPCVLKASKIIVSHEHYYFYRQRSRGVLSQWLLNEHYFDDLYKWYQYMKKRFQNNENYAVLERQLELYYIMMVSYGKRKFENIRKLYSGYEYLFPFDKVEKGSRIVLYGAGHAGCQYQIQVTQLQYCSLVLWVDKNYETYKEDGVMPVEAILDVEYDYVVIANPSMKTATTIEQKLKQMGVKQEKIVYSSKKSAERE